MTGRWSSRKLAGRASLEQPSTTVAGGAPQIAAAVETIGLILTPIAAFASLLYYFGWVRTAAFFGNFGIDANTLRYSPQDYLFRSIGVAFRPVAALLAACALAIAAFLALHAICERYSARPILIAVLCGAAAVLAPSTAILFGALDSGQPLLGAVGLIVGTVLLEFANTLWPLRRAPGPARTLRRATFAGVVALGVFWTFAIYAELTGDRLAKSWASRMDERPGVVVYSTTDLSLSGPGVDASKLPGKAGYQYRYAGLRLLIYSNKRWFLVPQGWRADNGAAAIILVDEKLRVEVTPGR
jgi:hypothetical protein